MINISRQHLYNLRRPLLCRLEQFEERAIAAAAQTLQAPAPARGSCSWPSHSRTNWRAFA
eukprot:6200459-Pleurochrysis_carterae.AAC.2